MSIRYRILKILESGPKYVREICTILNNKPYNFCWNVDGKDGRCKYWYKRPKYEKQRIRLVKPPCKHNPLYIIKIISELEKEGLVQKKIEYRDDPLSKWGKDKFVIVSLTKKGYEKISS